MKIKQFFLISWRKLWIMVVVGFVSIILHNLISGLTGKEEVFFFSVVIFIIPAYFLITVLLTAVNFISQRSSQKKSLSKK